MQFCVETISALNSGGSDYERMTCAKCLHQPFQQWELTDKKKGLTLNFILQRGEFEHNFFPFLHLQSAAPAAAIKLIEV